MSVWGGRPRLRGTSTSRQSRPWRSGAQSKTQRNLLGNRRVWGDPPQAWTPAPHGFLQSWRTASTLPRHHDLQPVEGLGPIFLQARCVAFRQSSVRHDYRGLPAALVKPDRHAAFIVPVEMQDLVRHGFRDFEFGVRQPARERVRILPRRPNGHPWNGNNLGKRHFMALARGLAALVLAYAAFVLVAHRHHLAPPAGKSNLFLKQEGDLAVLHHAGAGLVQELAPLVPRLACLCPYGLVGDGTHAYLLEQLCHGLPYTDFRTAWPRSSPSNSRTVLRVTGSRSSGARSAKGASTKRRARNRGCGISSVGVVITAFPYNRISMSIVRGPLGARRRRPSWASTFIVRCSNCTGNRPVSASATRFKNHCWPGTSMGSVS